MAGISLYDHQKEALKNMKNGCILCGGVGSGKSRTSLAYYYIRNGGVICDDEYVPLTKKPKDLYIITTARKRDTLEWDDEMVPFHISRHPELGLYHNKVVVDSWNNIKKYVDVKDAFFIFDEQRVVGYGTWSRSFIKISKHNEWILLSATPGDTWSDYLPVFIANGFFKNQKEFESEHCVFSRFVKYKKIDKYINVGRLVRLRNSILVQMEIERHTVSHHEEVYVRYDMETYRLVSRNRWNIYENAPIANKAELCYIWRKIVNSDPSRAEAVLNIQKKRKRCIIFYNFDYERDILLGLDYGDKCEIAEWSGHAHQDIPESEEWVYLVQYTAGCEGWNCIKTDTVIFYSQNYSYKVVEQATGRINRLNTPYVDLWYYHLKSRSKIDLGIARALKQKKKFNEGKFVDRGGY